MGNLYKGMILDDASENQTEGSWRFAKNIIFGRKPNTILNEDGFTDVTQPDAPNSINTISLVGYKVCDDSVILMYQDTAVGNNISYIYRYFFETDTPVLLLKETSTYKFLNFDVNYPIKADYIRNSNNDLIISWTDNNQPYKILNCDNNNFVLNGNKEPVDSTSFNKINNSLLLFRNAVEPLVPNFLSSIGKVNQTIIRGKLTSGVYFICFRYETEDGYKSFYSRVLNGVSITEEKSDIINAFSTYFLYGIDGKTGTNVRKGIEITLLNLDKNWDYIVPTVIYQKNNGETYFFEEPKQKITNYTTLKVQVTGENQGQQTNDLTALVQSNRWIKGSGLTFLQNKLFLSDLTENVEQNRQRLFNTITVNWCLGEQLGYPIADNTTSELKSFKAGEVYAFYGRIKFKDGTSSNAYHIPGRDVLAGDLTNITDGDNIPNIVTNSNLTTTNPYAKFRFLDTCTYDGLDSSSRPYGKMGYWINEDEQYPLNAAGNVHYVYNNIPGISTSNRKVRHHVFPSSCFLEQTKTFGKNSVLGVVFKNIPDVSTIPNAVSIEFFYAKKDDNNIKILATDITLKGGDITSTTTPSGLTALSYADSGEAPVGGWEKDEYSLLIIWLKMLFLK